MASKRILAFDSPFNEKYIFADGNSPAEEDAAPPAAVSRKRSIQNIIDSTEKSHDITVTSSLSNTITHGEYNIIHITIQPEKTSDGALKLGVTLNYDSQEGLKVTKISSNSAKLAGLTINDFITEIEGEELCGDYQKDINKIVSIYSEKGKINLTIKRFYNVQSKRDLAPQSSIKVPKIHHSSSENSKSIADFENETCSAVVANEQVAKLKKELSHHIATFQQYLAINQNESLTYNRTINRRVAYFKDYFQKEVMRQIEMQVPIIAASKDNVFKFVLDRVYDEIFTEAFHIKTESTSNDSNIAKIYMIPTNELQQLFNFTFCKSLSIGDNMFQLALSNEGLVLSYDGIVENLVVSGVAKLSRA